jgi:ribulose-phosphate 3-epimerase
MILLGIKTDPIQTRYTYSWLFDILSDENINNIQLGSFFELYHLEDAYFIELRELADRKNLRFKSVFTAHRELGGFFYDNSYMERVARINYEKLIHVASLLGADYCGSNPGAVYRDQMESKEKGMNRYLRHLKELMHLASEKKLKGLTIEPMSSLAEPPSTPEEIFHMMEELNSYHEKNRDKTVPVYLCGDISHGLVDVDYQVIYSNTEIFRSGIPYLAEFHFKNTDSIFQSTFGFSEEEKKRGIINLEEICNLLEQNRDILPVQDLVGYLEINGPKVVRDYSDALLEKAIRESLQALKSVFN